MGLFDRGQAREASVLVLTAPPAERRAQLRALAETPALARVLRIVTCDARASAQAGEALAARLGCWREVHPGLGAPCGEDRHAAARRILGALRAILAEHGGGDLLIVGSPSAGAILHGALIGHPGALARPGPGALFRFGTAAPRAPSGWAPACLAPEFDAARESPDRGG